MLHAYAWNYQQSAVKHMQKVVRARGGGGGGGGEQAHLPYSSTSAGTPLALPLVVLPPFTSSARDRNGVSSPKKSAGSYPGAPRGWKCECA